MPVTVTYLAMTDPAQLRPKPLPDGAEVGRLVVPSPDVNRYYYTEVGRDYSWTDRLNWTDEEWQNYASDPSVETWLMNADGHKAGYFELQREKGEVIDIRYFGLLPHVTGRGLGGALLTVAVQRAWQLGAKKVTVNTCTLDHKAALAHYIARGFQIVDERVRES